MPRQAPSRSAFVRRLANLTQHFLAVAAIIHLVMNIKPIVHVHSLGVHLLEKLDQPCDTLTHQMQVRFLF